MNILMLEKKYHVDYFHSILERIKVLDLGKPITTKTTHYYSQLAGKDVQKLVEYGTDCQIHILKERNGKFELIKKIKVDDLTQGFEWLKGKGCNRVDVVEMSAREYKYKSGTIGLYEINGVLKSVIIYYPDNEHSEIASKLGLSNHKLIKVPYNKYLRQMGSYSEKELL